MKIIGHRGNSSACHENTMAAFERAIADGADGIEFDLRLTKDRQWVLHHDAQISVSGRLSPISFLTLEEIAQLRIGPSHDPIPRLGEFLAWASSRKLVLMFDIKDRDGIDELVQTVERGGIPDQVIYSSFHYSVLKQLQTLRPDWPRALIVGSPRSKLARRLLMGSIIRWATRHRLTSLHLEEHWIVPSALERIRSAGFRIGVWTVDDPLRMALLEAFGVDSIITNRPDLACATLRGSR